MTLQFSGGQWDIGLLRQLPNGTLDPDFGLSGKVTYGTPAADEFADGVALQEEGKIIVAGDTCTGSSCQMLVLRFLPGGTPDPTFGTGGLVTVAVGSVTSSVGPVVLQDDGKIVAAGSAWGRSRSRLRPHPPERRRKPRPDVRHGRRRLDLARGRRRRRAAMGIHAGTGAITVAGYSCANAACTAGTRIGLARYLPDGRLDPLFGAGGIVITSISADDAADAVAVLPSGQPLVAGAALVGWSYDVASSPDTQLTGGCVVRWPGHC
jgi:uncharacterized delta-60 repeat protein